MRRVRRPVLRPARTLRLAMPPALLAEQGIGRGVQVNTRCVLTRVGVQAVVHDMGGRVVRTAAEQAVFVLADSVVDWVEQLYHAAVWLRRRLTPGERVSVPREPACVVLTDLPAEFVWRTLDNLLAMPEGKAACGQEVTVAVLPRCASPALLRNTLQGGGSAWWDVSGVGAVRPGHAVRPLTATSFIALRRFLSGLPDGWGVSGYRGVGGLPKGLRRPLLDAMASLGCWSTTQLLRWRGRAYVRRGFSHTMPSSHGPDGEREASWCGSGDTGGDDD